jgi:hypothetical protein
MNFLTLTARLRRKCRVVGTGPTTVIGQNEEYARLVDWINEAWMQIQRKRTDWMWMRNSMSFPVVDSQATYTLTEIESTGTGFSNFGNWDRNTVRCYLTATGTSDESRLGELDYNQYLNLYQYGASRTATGRPDIFCITPGNGIGLGPVPLGGYTVSADYFKVATEMTADIDTPSLPTQFHMAIVYRAMMFFGVSEAASEVYEEGLTEFRAIMAQIEDHQLPEMLEAGPLI